MLDGEILFEWNPGNRILLQPDYKEVLPPSNHTTNEEPKGNLGHEAIVFGEEERDITEYNRSEDKSVVELN